MSATVLVFGAVLFGVSFGNHRGFDGCPRDRVAVGAARQCWGSYPLRPTSNR